MSSVRYSSSFVISSIIYVVIIAIYFNIMDRPKPMHKPKEHRIKIAIITPPIPPKIKSKPIVKPTPVPPHIIVPPKIKKIKHKKVIKKKIHKKIIKKHKKRKVVIKKYKQQPKIKHKIKKVIKHKKVIKTPKIIPQPVKTIQKEQVVEVIEPYIEPIIEATPIPIQKKIITRPIKMETTHIPIQSKVITRQKPIKRVIPQQPKENLNLNAKKREFLKGVRAKIYTNKRYPALARRRNIQGRVHVVFDILANGEATNIRIDDTPRVLKKEVRRSIRKSFPIDIPSAIASMFPMRNISVNIDFKLE